jgi:activator of HSP90 ATPase
MPTKRTSGNDLVVSAGAAAAVAARRKPASAARKQRVVSQAEPSAILTAPRRTKTSAAQSGANAPTAEQIANLAYAIWESRGCQGGSPEEDWFAAEQKLRAGK